MPFDLCYTLAPFQRLINCTIQYLEGLSSYLDNVLLIVGSWDVHLKPLHFLFSRLDESGFTINLAKSTFGCATVTYLGHIVGQGTFRPKQANLKYPAPATWNSVMKFLGLVGFYRRLCCNFSTIAPPLTYLTSSKRRSVAWRIRWSPFLERG